MNVENDKTILILKNENLLHHYIAIYIAISVSQSDKKRWKIFSHTIAENAAFAFERR
jgi:hypothetical protein